MHTEHVTFDLLTLSLLGVGSVRRGSRHHCR